MNTVELFSRTGSFSKVAKERGHKICRLEIDTSFEAEIHKDILDVDEGDLPKQIDILWASPPCNRFSVASIGKNWSFQKYPKTSGAAIGMSYVLKTLEIIKELKPRYWFIENPRAMLRTLPFMQEHHRKTVTYCQYGDTRMKPTDIWTNLESWNSRPICKNGDSCHVASPRGSRTGTQGLKNATERGIVPSQLINEIFDVIEVIP